VIEARFWTARLRPLLVNECRAAGMRCHFERVENAVAVGTPDVDYCVAGVHGKMELKYAPRHPVRSSTPVLGRGNGLRRSQIIWAARRLSAGGRVFVAIGDPEGTWLIDLAHHPLPVWPEIELWTASRLGESAAWHSFQLIGPTLPQAITRAAVPWVGARARQDALQAPIAAR